MILPSHPGFHIALPAALSAWPFLVLPLASVGPRPFLCQMVDYPRTIDLYLWGRRGAPPPALGHWW